MQTKTKKLLGWKQAIRQAGQAHGRHVDARHFYGYVGAVTAALLVLIGVAVVFGRSMLVGPPQHIEAAAAPGSDRPRGQFLRRLPDGYTCRYTVFDNTAGQALQDKLGRCDEIVPPPTAPVRTEASKLDIRPHGFSWGGR
ncbi:hypothetical protein MXD81_55695 [Microbacteriaceae bacterium K1510]|nr:hypothetical protein [Microbacteriaceae bacterium K1510]